MPQTINVLLLDKNAAGRVPSEYPTRAWRLRNDQQSNLLPPATSNVSTYGSTGGGAFSPYCHSRFLTRNGLSSNHSDVHIYLSEQIPRDKHHRNSLWKPISTRVSRPLPAYKRKRECPLHSHLKLTSNFNNLLISDTSDRKSLKLNAWIVTHGVGDATTVPPCLGCQCFGYTINFRRITYTTTARTLVSIVINISRQLCPLCIGWHVPACGTDALHVARVVRGRGRTMHHRRPVVQVSVCRHVALIIVWSITIGTVRSCCAGRNRRAVGVVRGTQVFLHPIIFIAFHLLPFNYEL